MEDDVASAPASELLPCAHQVGGHHGDGGAPTTFVDRRGRFLKPLQSGERGERECAFYFHLSQLGDERRSGAGGGGGGGGAGGGGADGGGDDSAALRALRSFTPRYHGVQYTDGQALLILEARAAVRASCAGGGP